MLIGNASVAAIETGEWEWARSELDVGLEEASSEEERIVLLDFFVQLRVQGGGNADTELDEADAWLGLHVAHEPYLESNLGWNRAVRALQDGDLAASAAGYLESGRRDPYNAVGAFGEAAFMALLASERALVETAGGALRDTESHAAMARVTLRLVDAGIAAFDGNPEAAQTGLLTAYADFRDLGAARKQALTGLAMATLLDTSDPRVRAAVDESRQLFEQMGAGLWLGLLDEALAKSDVTPASPASEPAAGTAEGAASAAPA
jgi:hypothetical protein